MKIVKYTDCVNLLKMDYCRKRNRCPKRLMLVDFIIYSLLDSGFRVVFLQRHSSYFESKQWKALASIFSKLMHHTGHCWISPTAEIGGGFVVAHVGGIVIGGGVIIGENCDIRQNVTLGGNYGKLSTEGRAYPVIGNNVSFGAGCVVVGPITVGNNCVIGANSVVNKNVQDGVVVSGIPAKVIRNIWDDHRKP